MTSLPLRWRIIIALLTLALTTTLALTLLSRRYLEKSLQFSVNTEMGQALTEALSLAKENYEGRKGVLAEAGQQLTESDSLLPAFQAGNPDRLDSLLDRTGLGKVSLRFVSPAESLPGLQFDRLGNGPQVFKSPDREDLLQLAIPIRELGQTVAALIVTERLDELLNVKRAVHTYKHLQMREGDLRRGFLLAFLAAATGVVLLACLLGIRIGFSITKPLHALIKGTRELARDNLDYRIPQGQDDEIGLLVESFNRMAEDLKENRQQRLEAEKIAAWREMARRLAHEIKNPLTPIQLTVQQMRDKYAGDDPAYRKLTEECTEIVTEEVENLRALVQEFANFARMPSLSLAGHDLNTVVMDVVRLYPDARIKLDLGSDLPELNLDAEQIRRVLINLIENGIEAAGENGALTISTETRDGSVQFLVIDSGPGVAPEDRQRIFQPYISTKQSGMGLGLAVVRSIVEEHGGRVSVTESSAGGAQFEILLPLPEEAEERLEVQT